MPSTEIALIVSGIWLLFLTAGLFLFSNSLRREIRIAKIEETKKLLDKINEGLKVNGSDIEKIKKAINSINTAAIGHVQKVGLIRFNPFNEIGGDHSFSLAILDGANNGIIITGLHTRDRTRIYAKQITVGKSDLELSAEENKALLKAQKV
jgi:hypothetical protein